ncbi:hypothetical protein WA158_005718 [Blastocystis sp. Blastoise]
MPFDISSFVGLNEGLKMYEEMIKDSVNIFSFVMSLGNHLERFIESIKVNTGYESVNNNDDKSEILRKSSSDQEFMVRKDRISDVLFDDDDDDDDMDLIRFTNNGPVFQISKSVLDSLKGSYIEEQREEGKRTNDGTIFLCYEGQDVFVYYLLDYLNGKKVDFDSFSYEEQLQILNLFEFCGLVIPIELIDCREKRDRNMNKYEEGNEVSLIINGNTNDTIKEYLVKNGLWNEYVKNYDNGFINYKPIDKGFYMNKKYEYIEYITEYVNNGYIDIEEDKISDINKELLEKEMVELFGDEGREEAKEAMIPGWFKQSTIINKELTKPLVNWLGKEKKWKLLFRASEHDYKASEFHKYCDNQGETVTIIKHIGHNNHINIFGGYTDQNWESGLEVDKSRSKEFIFTLSNEHNIAPTQYGHNNEGRGIYCDSNYGPTFGIGCDIGIYDCCHSTDKKAWNHLKSFTSVNTPQKNSLFVNTNDPDDYNYFRVEDYEVWGRE